MLAMDTSDNVSVPHGPWNFRQNAAVRSRNRTNEHYFGYRREQRNLYDILCTTTKTIYTSLFIFFLHLSKSAVVGQHTTPTELPIFGDPFTEISLELIFPKGKPLFLLNGKTLQLLQPLDRDEENISHIVFQVSSI